jgi:hypothetical protein
MLVSRKHDLEVDAIKANLPCLRERPACDPKDIVPGLPQGSWTPGKGSGGQLEVGRAQVAQR